MDRFVVLATITDQALANRKCAALEDAGIPVMIEHRDFLEGNTVRSGFRLLVPSEFCQKAQRLTGLSAPVLVVKPTAVQ